MWRNVYELDKALTKKDGAFIINFSNRITKSSIPFTLHSKVSRNINLPLPASPPRVRAVNDRQSSDLYSPAVLCFAFRTVIGIFAGFVQVLTACDAPQQANSTDRNKSVRKGARVQLFWDKAQNIVRKVTHQKYSLASTMIGHSYITMEGESIFLSFFYLATMATLSKPTILRLEVWRCPGRLTWHCVKTATWSSIKSSTVALREVTRF